MIVGSKNSSNIGRSLVVAGLLLTASAALVLLSPEHLSETLARRLLGALLGAVVVSYANAVPKMLTPLARLRCDPSTEQAVRRFTGWTLVLGGLGYVAAWLFAPLDHASTIAIAALGSAVLLVAIRYSLVIGRRPGAPR